MIGAELGSHSPEDPAGFCLGMIELSPIPMIFVEGGSHRVRGANRAFFQMTGTSEEEVVGKPFAQSVPKAALYMAQLERASFAADPGLGQVAESASPSTLPGLCVAWPVVGAEGMVRGLVVQFRQADPAHAEMLAMNEQLVVSAVRQLELTETAESLNRQLQVEMADRATAQRALAEQARLLDLSNDAIIVRDVRNRVTYWNHGAEELYGWSRQEAVGRDLHELLKTEFEIPLENLLEELLRLNRLSGEVVQVTKAGQRVHLLCRWALDRDQDGNPASILTTTTDITRRKQVEEDLRHAKEAAEMASRAKDHFLATLSHELRTPLNPVLMTASALRGDASLPGPIREQLAMIERNVALEARLIDDLLDVTRIARGKLVLQKEPCDIHALMRFVVEMVCEQAREKRIEITLNLGATRAVVMGDPTRIQQVFWNLLINAVNFTPRGGRIEVCSRNVEPEGGNASGPRLRIEFRDNGSGLEAEALERIFDPFEQMSERPEHRAGGLGLGLAIARAVVQLHNGTIRAQSAGAGLGSTFIVELPGAFGLPAGEVAPTRPKGTNEDEAEVEPSMRLLVVDDHRSTLEVLTRLLVRAGHQVTTATSLEEARLAATRQSFDALVSDIGLPDGSGVDLMKELHAKYHLHGIAISGYGMEEDVHRSSDAGFIGHLVKPINMGELRRALRHMRPVAK